MVANPRYRPGPQKIKMWVVSIWAIGNCKSSHIMLAPIHHQQVAVTVLGRGQPLSEYAQNCQRKIYRQKLCRPRLANIHCLWFTKSLKNCHRSTILHHTTFITLLSCKYVLVYLRLSTLLFIHCSARYKVHLLSAECLLWVNLCWRAVGCLCQGRGWLLYYCTCCYPEEMEMRGDDWLANYAAWPGQENWLQERHQWQLHLTKQSAATEISREELVQLHIYLEFQFSRGLHACMIVEHNNATLFLRCCWLWLKRRGKVWILESLDSVTYGPHYRGDEATQSQICNVYPPVHSRIVIITGMPGS